MLVRIRENSARIRSVSFKWTMSIPFLWFAYTIAVFLTFKSSLLEMSKLKMPYTRFHEKTLGKYVFRAF